MIVVVLVSQTVIDDPVPADGAGVIVIVATEVSFGHGDVPITIYLNVLVVVPAKTVKVPAP